MPEHLKLCCSRGSRVACVADHGTGQWLLRWVIVSHIVVRVENAIGALGLSDVFDRVVALAKVRLVETRAESIFSRAHAPKQEGDMEEIHLVRYQPSAIHCNLGYAGRLVKPWFTEVSTLVLLIDA